jgi:hypothetical protein
MPPSVLAAVSAAVPVSVPAAIVRRWVAVVLVACIVVSCGSKDEGSGPVEQLFPDVVEVESSRSDDGTWSFAVTLSSPYDTPERYADAWRVSGPDGTVYGIRELAHDHQNEQPFTRSLSGVEIPADVDAVTVQGRDQVSGWGGATIEHRLQR